MMQILDLDLSVALKGNLCNFILVLPVLGTIASKVTMMIAAAHHLKAGIWPGVGDGSYFDRSKCDVIHETDYCLQDC
jgi:hypothetical protein